MLSVKLLSVVRDMMGVFVCGCMFLCVRVCVCVCVCACARACVCDIMSVCERVMSLGMRAYVYLSETDSLTQTQAHVKVYTFCVI